MDTVRHPWETSRVRAVRSILKDSLKAGSKALDIGCGDGFVSRELFKGAAIKSVTAVDINLTKDAIKELSKRGQGITYLNKLPKEKGCYGLVLLLDVIEHVEGDSAFLKEVRAYLDKGGRILVTAPAFNSLFSAHDRFLHHVRRYSLKELKSLAESSDLKCVSSGYLFTSLLLPRFVSVIIERLFKKAGVARGAGDWRAGQGAAKITDLILRTDNNISLAVNRIGLKLPGLTAWVLCERRQ